MNFEMKTRAFFCDEKAECQIFSSEYLFRIFLRLFQWNFHIRHVKLLQKSGDQCLFFAFTIIFQLGIFKCPFCALFLRFIASSKGFSYLQRVKSFCQSYSRFYLGWLQSNFIWELSWNKILNLLGVCCVNNIQCCF